MDEISDAVIALPGGFGTLEAISEMIGSKNLLSELIKSLYSSIKITMYGINLCPCSGFSLRITNFRL